MATRQEMIDYLKLSNPQLADLKWEQMTDYYVEMLYKIERELIAKHGIKDANSN